MRRVVQNHLLREVTSYIVRLEMPDPTTCDQYAELHDRMRSIGFLKEIRGDSGVLYQLPDAEYHGYSHLDCVALRDLVQGIADQVRGEGGVLVTECPSAAWRLMPAA